MVTPAKKLGIAGLVLLAALDAASAERMSGTLEKIKKAGAIAIGYREMAMPLSYKEGQQPAGLSIDLCSLVVEKIKNSLNIADLKIDYQPVTPENRISLIQSGTLDILCGATPVSPKLREEAGFSIPIFMSELKWLVPRRFRTARERRHRHREYVAPSWAEDLKDKTVVLTKGSPGLSLVLTLSTNRSLGLSIVEGSDNAESFQLLETGRASAFLADEVLLLALKSSAKNPDNFVFLGDAYPGPSYTLVFRKDDKPFEDLVNGALAEAIKSGAFAKLYSKWFESPIPPQNVNLQYPMPDTLKALMHAEVSSAQ